MRKTMFGSVVVDWRNQVATLAALDANAPHVVTMWGAVHAPGIGAGLVANGFALAHEQWVTAIAKHPEPADSESVH
jgi:L-ribulose-5-phosphate 3-epimerase UlaE